MKRMSHFAAKPFRVLRLERRLQRRKSLCRDFADAARLAGFNPAKDSLVETVERFRQRKLRHLLLNLKGGGLVVVCADPEMGRRIRLAIEGLENDSENGSPAMPQMPFEGCQMLAMPKPDAPQGEFNNFFGALERAIGGN